MNVWGGRTREIRGQERGRCERGNKVGEREGRWNEKGIERGEREGENGLLVVTLVAIDH